MCSNHLSSDFLWCVLSLMFLLLLLFTLCVVCLMLNLWFISCMFLKNVILPTFTKMGNYLSFLDWQHYEKQHGMNKCWTWCSSWCGTFGLDCFCEESHMWEQMSQHVAFICRTKPLVYALVFELTIGRVFFTCTTRVVVIF